MIASVGWKSLGFHRADASFKYDLDREKQGCSDYFTGLKTVTVNGKKRGYGS